MRADRSSGVNMLACIDWIETDGIRYCGGGTTWGNFNSTPFGIPVTKGGCPELPKAWTAAHGVAACEQLCAPDPSCLGFTWYPGSNGRSRSAGSAGKSPEGGVYGRNLTACCFRAGSVSSKPTCSTASCAATRCYEKPPPPPPPPAPPVPVKDREVMLWVYMHNESNTTVWDEYLTNFTTWMRPNVSSVSLCMYRVETDGSFGYQDAPHSRPHTGQNQEKFGVPRFRKTGVKQYPLIDANYPGGNLAMHKMFASNASRAMFINGAMAKLAEQKFDGYNLDVSHFEANLRSV